MSSSEKRRMIRIQVKRQLRAYIKSVGSHVKHEFETIDVSVNGLLLHSPRTRRYPFSEATLLEVWLQLDDEDKTVIFFNAKVARSFEDKKDDGRLNFGLRIIQIEKGQEERLVRYIDENRSDSETDEVAMAS